jgi:ABC-type amino acid transport substrate-binding protein
MRSLRPGTNVANQTTTPDSVIAAKSTPPPARFFDVIVLVFLFMVCVAFLSYIYYRGLADEVEGAQREVRSLRERDATLQEKLDSTIAMAELNDADARVPHPSLHDRNANFIGDHADVSWTYDSKADSHYLSYEIELWRDQGGRCNSLNSDAPHSHLPNEQFWNGCFNGPIKFIASDPGSGSSRIPANLDHELQSGSYSWRVAPIRAGSNVSPGANDTELLSDWSELSSFNIHKSVLDRIMQTHEVRVGTNFEQDTHFSSRDENGYEVGFDISLIRTLVEGCLRLGQLGIEYDASNCARAIEAAQEEGFENEVASSVCRSSPDTKNLCVRFVPVGSWGGWQSILKRKEIDLFIGSVTRAAARERAGIVFTDGYLNYQTKLYAHKTDLTGRPALLSTWLTKDRVVGVIASSTNAYLLDHLLQEDHKNNIKEITYTSYPALESAMERGELDGIIIDDTFVSNSHTDWVSLPDLAKTQAWITYTSEYIGSSPEDRKSPEQIAIATVREETDASRGLYSALQAALKDKEINKKLLPALCRTFWKDSLDRCANGAAK